jgi:hypothetical protein
MDNETPVAIASDTPDNEQILLVVEITPTFFPVRAASSTNCSMNRKGSPG